MSISFLGTYSSSVSFSSVKSFLLGFFLVEPWLEILFDEVEEKDDGLSWELSFILK